MEIIDFLLFSYLFHTGAQFGVLSRYTYINFSPQYKMASPHVHFPFLFCCRYQLLPPWLLCCSFQRSLMAVSTGSIFPIWVLQNRKVSAHLVLILRFFQRNRLKWGDFSTFLLNFPSCEMWSLSLLPFIFLHDLFSGCISLLILFFKNHFVSGYRFLCIGINRAYDLLVIWSGSMWRGREQSFDSSS